MKVCRWVVIIWVGLVSHGVFAQAQDDGYVVATDQFAALMAKRGDAREMPRLTDQKVAGLITTMSDTERFLHSRKYGQSDMTYLLDMCDRANKMVMGYVLFDGRRGIKPESTREQMTEQVVKNMNENVLAYQPEVERLMPFLLHCVSTQVPILTKFVDNLKPEQLTNIRRDGLNKMRRGLFRTYSGFIEMVGNPQTRESLRNTVFKALADTANNFAKVFSVVDRTQVLRLLETLDSKQPGNVQAALKRIQTAMQSKDCQALCKY